MIKIVSVYAASDGQTFQTELEAKGHEVRKLLEGMGLTDGVHVDRVAQEIVTQWKFFAEIMDTKPDAPPKRRPRSDKGKNHAKRNDKAALNRELQDMKQ